MHLIYDETCVILRRKRRGCLLGNFGYIGIFLLAAIGFAATTILLPVTLRFLGIIPRKPNPTKYTTYECGMETVGKSWVQFNFRYYFFALLFVVFDIQVVFLYPWAVHFKQLKLFGLVEMLAFVLIVVVGFVYAWRKGVLQWK
ncbi:MAG: NADH-quinone oxidoreductase subunit A [Dehalococcoidia bacterium]|nr:NADH-quinone oxidoreductase subunit A [Dehalococcoidia bacterium]